MRQVGPGFPGSQNNGLVPGPFPYYYYYFLAGLVLRGNGLIPTVID